MVRDFRVLSDVEFEEVTADLLAAETGIPFERFRRAPDGGVDLRSTISGSLEIVQCKHYLRSTFKQLKRDLAAELPNLVRESPATYRVATSFDLSRREKDRLYEMFAAWMPDPSYVMGARDLDGLLTRHPAVEKRYVKLWLVSGGVLQTMLQAAIHERTNDLLERVMRALPRYVESDGLRRATTLLEDHRVCIISGPPGIGKTTLAQILLARSITFGYQPVEISHDIEEAWATYDPTLRQIFYYDDFLGRISLGERLLKNEDHRLVEFMDKVRLSESKLMLLTTREYILEEARNDYEELTRLDERLELVMRLDDYTRLDRARILYNHAWHADLTDDDLAALMSDNHYLDIIDHKNFNPRLIEYITRPPIVTRADDAS